MRPDGRLPVTIENVSGLVAPVTTAAKFVGMSVVMLAQLYGYVKTTTTAGADTVQEYTGDVSSSPLESTTLIETVPLLAVVAVPLTKPVVVLSARPAGNAPVTIENVSGAVEPVTTAAKLVADEVLIDAHAYGYVKTIVTGTMGVPVKMTMLC